VPTGLGQSRRTQGGCSRGVPSTAGSGPQLPTTSSESLCLARLGHRAEEALKVEGVASMGGSKGCLDPGWRGEALLLLLDCRFFKYIF
jgi:hypothetical protein